jgi:hypothetical protein
MEKWGEMNGNMRPYNNDFISETSKNDFISIKT